MRDGKCGWVSGGDMWKRGGCRAGIPTQGGIFALCVVGEKAGIDA